MKIVSGGYAAALRPKVIDRQFRCKTYFLSEHDVIIEVDEPSGKPRNAMEMDLDSWGAESGEVGFVWEDFFVANLKHKSVADQSIECLPVKR